MFAIYCYYKVADELASSIRASSGDNAVCVHVYPPFLFHHHPLSSFQ